jgi:hypothetical protein
MIDRAERLGAYLPGAAAGKPEGTKPEDGPGG